MIQPDLRQGKRRHPSERTLEERTTTNGGISYRRQLDSSPRVLPASTTGGRAERNIGGESRLSGATGSGVCPGSYVQSASLREFPRMPAEWEMTRERMERGGRGEDEEQMSRCRGSLIS